MQQLNDTIAQANQLVKQAWQATDETDKINLIVKCHDLLYEKSVEYYHRKSLEGMK